ncbi:MAG: phage terminase large subunit family protein [Phycisphaerae bacterium]|jgi:hypothetical protein|nr:phage terminase large subunit family protein [Phycisphaerae bacterium]
MVQDAQKPLSPTDPEVLKQVSPGIWATYQYKDKDGNPLGLKLASGQHFSFEGREYLKEPLEITCCEKVAMKATGGGFSECAIVRTLHGMRYGRYPQGVGYYFPTDDDMQDYVKSRFNPVIANNHAAIGKYFKTGGKATDSASIKRIFDSNLYMRGATLKPGEDDGARKSTKTSGIQLDRAVLDEVDQMEAEVIAKIRGRMANACVDGIKGFYEFEFIGNPSDEDRGVDLLWQGSDKRYWFRQCSCGGLTCAEIEFINDPEKTVGFYHDRSERERTHQPLGYIRCVKCGKPVGTRNGKWIAEVPSVKTRIGYNWSHLTSEYQDPARILRDYRKPPENNLGDVMRLDLGLAYSSQDEKLRKDNVYACCGNQGIAESHSGPCAMGVDNDDGKHVVIGGRTGNDRYELFKPVRCDDFKGVYDLVRRFGVKSAVVDCRPNKDSAEQFAKACRAIGCRVYLCEYTESILQDAVFNEDTGIVKVYRTGIFDATHRLFVENHILLPRICAVIKEYALQCCNCVKSKEKNKKTGQIVFRYKKTGRENDHYRNATNYFLLAAKRIARVKSPYNTLQDSKDCITEYTIV